MHGAEVVYECGKGRMISQTAFTQKFVCDITGNWYPSLDSIRCVGEWKYSIYSFFQVTVPALLICFHILLSLVALMKYSKYLHCSQDFL